MGLITQGAAVLRHSIYMAHRKSKYDFQMYALVHPSAKECSHVMSKLGYTVLIRNTPFDKQDIQNEFLRENIDGASCCGAKEFIKLYAYALVNHPVAVILDLDSLILKPLDDLIDSIILGEVEALEARKRLPLHGDLELPKKIDAFYTRDYNMVNPGGEEYAGVQGGFLMLRPSEEAFEEYIDIILEGNYVEGQGWGGKYGYFFGGMQIQGICAYFYKEKHPEFAIELNRCEINSMADNPNFNANDKQKPNLCRDGREKCEDCREMDVSKILSAHFTICQKPWNCVSHWDLHSTKICSQLHSEWFRIRRDFEESRRDGSRQTPEMGGSHRPEIHFGYCISSGQRGYIPIKV
mmetsp:Transcript_24006/g.49054  ORF Transcript_24006/g.49054 Transcript_24006/m.49054 type:complete len:351 (+) Transcript_24006:72-1124(+)